MAKSFVTASGTPIQLGRELGKGGEGSVFEVPALPNQVAKLYHRALDKEKQAKLSFMATHADQSLLNYAAWPQATLHAVHGGAVAGFLMPKVVGRDPIHMLYSPAHRRQERPKAAWDFLLFSARNIAAAFETLHAHGHVLGDVNQGNVMVGSDSKVVLIDCDSFQINANGALHLCEVGVSHFTPPELQGLSSFHGVKRTANHDNFGLALLIFHLLFGGRHPYSGVPLRKEAGEALESDIKAFRYAYASDAQGRGMSPPPNSIPISLVPSNMEAMFFQAFTEKGTITRPSAKDWVTHIDALRARLKKCATTPMHVYPDHVKQCPWCTLEQKGVVYFIDVGAVFTNIASGFVLAKVWAIIEAVPAPAQPVISRFTDISVTAQPLPPGVPSDGQQTAIRIAVLSAIFILFLAFPKGWLIWAIAAFFGWTMTDSSNSTARTDERRRRQNVLDQARKEYDALVTRMRTEAGPEGFQKKRQELAKLREEYQALPAREKSEIDQLHATAEARQKHQFLDRCFIDAATIPGVGPAKKAALRSFGIETAADVTKDKVRTVKGFGEVLTNTVVDWRKSCERRFTFNSQNAVSEADKNAVRARIATRKKMIEVGLTAGAAELQRFRQEATSKAAGLEPMVKAAATKCAQASADLSIL